MNGRFLLKDKRKYVSSIYYKKLILRYFLSLFWEIRTNFEMVHVNIFVKIYYSIQNMNNTLIYLLANLLFSQGGTL